MFQARPTSSQELMDIINLHASTEESENAQFKKDNSTDNHLHRDRDFKRDHGDGSQQRIRNADVFVAKNTQQRLNRQEFLDAPCQFHKDSKHTNSD